MALLVTKNHNIIPCKVVSCFPHLHLSKCPSLSLHSSSSRSRYLSLYTPTPPHSPALPPLVSELLSLSLSLPELTTQEVTTDSINSSYINPAIIAPPARLSAPSLSPPHPLPPSSAFDTPLPLLLCPTVCLFYVFILSSNYRGRSLLSYKTIKSPSWSPHALAHAAGATSSKILILCKFDLIIGEEMSFL